MNSSDAERTAGVTAAGKTSLALLHSIFESLSEQARARQWCASRTIRTQGKTIQLDFSSPELAELFAPAFGHLSAEGTGAHDARIVVCASTGGLAPDEMLLEQLFQQTRNELAAAGGRPIFFAASGQRTFAGQYRSEMLSLDMFDAGQNLAIVWIRHPQQLSLTTPGFLAAPLRTVLGWYFLSRESVLCHASAVGHDHGGVLLVGRGGAGKTTCALAAVEAGLRYAGDDSVLATCTADGGVQIDSLYCSARLEPRDLVHFPWLEPAVDPSSQDIAGQGAVRKCRAFFSPLLREKLIQTFPLRAVVVPKLVSGNDAQLTPISAMEAVRTFAPSTLMHIAGHGQKTFSAISRIAHRVPCYELRLGRNSADRTAANRTATNRTVAGTLLKELSSR